MDPRIILAAKLSVIPLATERFKNASIIGFIK